MDYYLLASTNDVATNLLQIHLKFQFYTVIIRTMVVSPYHWLLFEAINSMQVQI